MKYKHELAYGDIRGFSCAYRNWKDDDLHDESPFLHGYALSFVFVFVAEDGKVLDEFVRTKTTIIEQYLEEVFRNTVLVAKDDPAMDAFLALETAGACELRINDEVGAEIFARELWAEMAPIVLQKSDNAVSLYEVKVRENGNYTTVFTDYDLNIEKLKPNGKEHIS